MDQDAIRALVDVSMNTYFWWFVGASAALFFKNLLENFVWGLTFVFGRDYNVDDEVLIGGIRKARIVRQTVTKTVFYLYDNNTVLVIPNKELHSLRCEKKLSGEGLPNPSVIKSPKDK